MGYPRKHFLGTPRWVRFAIAEAIQRADVSASKWTVPLETMAFYESGFNPAANLCLPDSTGRTPIGMMQQSVPFYRDAKEVDPEAHAGLGGFADPVRAVLMAIMHIDSRLSVSGGYGGIGQLDGSRGLLPRTDRGPGNVLRTWVANPTLDAETLRPHYRGY